MPITLVGGTTAVPSQLLAGVLYDPATAVSKSIAAALAMTAFDTTNLRLTFTAPSTGNVKVCQSGVATGTTVIPAVIIGVLDGTTIRGRAPAQFVGPISAPSAGSYLPFTAEFVVVGLTPGITYTWDAAYDCEVAATSGNIKYGGPNNTTAGDAWGGYGFEIWAA
jgi:hypothetical protein